MQFGVYKVYAREEISEMLAHYETEMKESI